jgi:hypothetical protein
MTKTSYSAICIALSLVGGLFPVTDPLMLSTNDDAVVYETFFRGGKIEYTEQDTGTGEVRKYLTVQAPIQNPPLQNYWESQPRGGTRSFVPASTSTGYEAPTVASVSDTSLVAFRSAADASLSAIAIGLRNPPTAAGNSGATSTPVTVTVPPQSVIYAAVVFRKSTQPIQINFNSKVYKGSDSAGFFEIARNETMSPVDVVVSGRTEVAQTTFWMTLSQTSAGPNVAFVTGRFGSEPTAVSAAIITQRL